MGEATEDALRGGSEGVGMGQPLAQMRILQVRDGFGWVTRVVAVAVILLAVGIAAHGQADVAKKVTWKQVEFAIVKFNDDAPNSWNIYHSEKKGVFLVRVWKRYLLVNVENEEVYDLDPQKITVKGDSVEWSPSDRPEKPIETPEWKERDVGPVERVRFRLGKYGHFLELQIPMGPNGRPIY